MKSFPKSPNDGARRFVASWTRTVLCLAILFVGVGASAQETNATLEFDQSAWREDGFPLLARHDAKALRSIWSTLETATAPKPFAKAVTLQLLKQGSRYKGKLLTVEGRLLRAERVALLEDESCYCLWILLPDSKRDPIRLITRRAPEGFEPDSLASLPKRAGDRDVEYRHETLRATAVYYRSTAYDAGDDLRAAPTLVAESFTLTNGAKFEDDRDVQTGDSWLMKSVAILAIVTVWFVTRSRMKNRRRKSPSSGVTAIALLVVAFTSTNAWAQELEGAALWSKLANVAPEEWTLETSDARPSLDAGTPESAQRRATALAILGISDRLMTTDVLLRQEKRGDVEKVQGVLTSLESIPLSPVEEERLGAERFYRATIMLDDETSAAIYFVKPPTFQVPASFFDRPRPTTEPHGLGDRVATLGIKFGVEANAEKTFLATRLRWLPDDAPLGRLGVDLAAFEAVPVYRHNALEKAKTQEERETIVKSMRWTTSDRRSFYGALAGFKERAAIGVDRRASADVVSLFNEPERRQGARVHLRGWVRRVNMILVTDPEIKAETGLERYYQLFLFTNDSQGWPIALCVPELPDGLETGGGSDYRRELEFDGFFYKTWAYQIDGDAATPEEEESAPSLAPDSPKSWTRAPVVVGRIVRVEPEEEAPTAPWSPTELFLSFATLASAWIVLRYFARRRQKPTHFPHN